MIRLYSKTQQQKDFKQKDFGLAIFWQWVRGFNSVAFLQTFSPKHRFFFALSQSFYGPLWNEQIFHGALLNLGTGIPSVYN